MSNIVVFQKTRLRLVLIFYLRDKSAERGMKASNPSMKASNPSIKAIAVHGHKAWPNQVTWEFTLWIL